MKKALFLFPFLLILAACAGQPSPTPTAAAPTAPPTALPPTATQPPALSLEILRNGLYTSPDWGAFQLTDGIYYRTPPTTQESPEAYTTRILDTVLYGDLNADGIEDAVVCLATQNGGTGHFVEMAAVVNSAGGAVNSATLSLGDRVIVEAGAIQDGLISLDMRVQGPDDPMCCPSQSVTWTFRLENGQLLKIP